jgi:hypothetical protein
MVADAGAVGALRPSVATLRADLGSPVAWVARVGADQAAATLAGAALWLVAIWFGIAAGAVATATLPGLLGRVGHQVAAVALPRAVWRVVAGAAGLGVLLAPVSAGADSPRGPAPYGSATPLPAPAWPEDTALPVPAWPEDTRLPVPAWPEDTAPPAPTLPSAAPPTPEPAPGAAAAPGDVVIVGPGDSLWSITATQLGATATDARVAAEWPRWYARNQRTVGADPALIFPGEVLHAPAVIPEVTP